MLRERRAAAQLLSVAEAADVARFEGARL